MIRIAESTDVKNIVDLIGSFVDDFLVDEKGREKFSSSVIQELVDDPKIHYLVYLENNQIIGVISCRELSHIVHFFVDKQYHGKGIGKQLWNHIEYLVESNKTRVITVNSSSYAENIYKKMGFETISDVIEQDGLRFIKMQKHML